MYFRFISRCSHMLLEKYKLFISRLYLTTGWILPHYLALKTRMMELQIVKRTDGVLAVLTQYTNVTDKRQHRQMK